MPTELLYLTDSYLQTASAKILDVQDLNGQTAVILDRTVFYPQGGGQPADQGRIMGELGSLQVSHVSYNSGEVLHNGQLEGQLSVGDEVQLVIEWPVRLRQMQWHTAGHILDQAVKNTLPESKSVDGNHGIGKKLYVEFSAPIHAAELAAIQDQLNSIIEANLPITFEMVTKDQLVERHIHLPFDLPGNKSLRIVQIGEYPPMPDGGTQLHTTGDTLPVLVTGVQEKEGKYRVVYEVETVVPAPSVTSQEELPPVQNVTTTSQTQSLETLVTSIAALKQKLESDLSHQEPDLITKYLGKKGHFNELAKLLRELSTSDRRQAGQVLNELKLNLETKLHDSNPTAGSEPSWVDLTVPGITPPVGHMHPISQAMEEITGIFERVGFTRVRYPEVDWDWYVFTALNMPPNHPARDEWETFFVAAAASPDKGQMVLTTHTSNGQVREMERLHSQPPIRMINIARCYRRQQDATHTQMFHQFEGLVVDKGINIQNLKGTLDYFAEAFYGPGTKSRIRPFHFQFTEPSFEVDFSCHICNGTGLVTDPDTGENTKCKFCKSGWHEVGGAGMVHPNVLKAGGINPDEYTGFAFGWGIERTYTLKQGLNIDDIRLFYSGDLRFLEQF